MAIEAANEGVTHELVTFVTNTAFSDIPNDAIEIAKRCIVDGAACMMAGSVEPAPTILRRLARERIDALRGGLHRALRSDERRPVRLERRERRVERGLLRVRARRGRAVVRRHGRDPVR